jgi:glutamate decarboxylase
MALHEKHSIRHRIDDEIYASSDLETSIPKYKFPERERDPLQCRDPGIQ